MKTALITAAFCVVVAAAALGFVRYVDHWDNDRRSRMRDTCQALAAQPVVTDRGGTYVCIAPDGRVVGPVAK